MPDLATIAPFGFDFDPARFLGAYRSIGARTAQFYRHRERPPSVRDALRTADAAGVPFDSLHGVFGEDIDPSSDDPVHRRECLRIYGDEARLARDLVGRGRVPVVIVHPAPWNPGRVAMPPAEARRSDLRRRPALREFLRALADVAAQRDVIFAVENLPFDAAGGTDPAALAAEVHAVGSPGIRMCLDLGHAHLTTGDAGAAVRAAAPAVAWLHVHDNHGRADDHLMPGDGAIDWSAVGAALRETGLAAPGAGVTFMLEVFYDEARVEAMARSGLADRIGRTLGLA
jgi:sugar phosphate isomerase/epimerase